VSSWDAFGVERVPRSGRPEAAGVESEAQDGPTAGWSGFAKRQYRDQGLTRGSARRGGSASHLLITMGVRPGSDRNSRARWRGAPPRARLVAVGDPEALERAARHAEKDAPVRVTRPARSTSRPSPIGASPFSLPQPTRGAPSSRGAHRPVQVARQPAPSRSPPAALERRAAGIVTAPISEGAQAAGYPFRATSFGARGRGGGCSSATGSSSRQSTPRSAGSRNAHRRVADADAGIGSALRIFRWGGRKTVACSANPHAERGNVRDEESRIAPAIERRGRRASARRFSCGRFSRIGDRKAGWGSWWRCTMTKG
jgi:hypothetical protein